MKGAPRQLGALSRCVADLWRGLLLLWQAVPGLTAAVAALR